MPIDPIQNLAIPSPLTNYSDAISGTTVAFYIVYIWRALIFIGGLLVLVYFIQGAFEWIGANGEASKITTARNKMTGAITGFIVLISVFAILSFIEGIFGLNILRPSLPSATDSSFTSGAASGARPLIPAGAIHKL